jgi:hypothetical protein
MTGGGCKDKPDDSMASDGGTSQINMLVFGARLPLMRCMMHFDRTDAAQHQQRCACKTCCSIARNGGSFCLTPSSSRVPSLPRCILHSASVAIAIRISRKPMLRHVMPSHDMCQSPCFLHGRPCIPLVHAMLNIFAVCRSSMQAK